MVVQLLDENLKEHTLLRHHPRSEITQRSNLHGLGSIDGLEGAD